MSDSWKTCINKSVGIQKIRDINEYIECVNTQKYKSAIDNFYEGLRNILNIANDPSVFEDDEKLGPLLFIGIISITENYFREIISDIVKICPISQNNSSNQTITLGSVIWHSPNNFERTVLENISLADEKAIKDNTRKIIGYVIDPKGLTSSAIEEFGKLCQLRHAIVHSANIVAGKNATKLNLKSDKKLVKVNIKYKQIQECASICTILVNSYNLELFEQLAKRWAVDWNKTPMWNNKNDGKLFSCIWDIFYSEIDAETIPEENRITKQKCKNAIKKEYNR